MGYVVDFEDGIVWIRVTGEWNPELARGAQQDSVRLVEAHGARDLLVDLREAVHDVNTLDIHQVTASHAKVYPPGTRHAVVMPELDGGMRQFAEDVAHNRGVPLRLFDSVVEGLAWLRERAG